MEVVSIIELVITFVVSFAFTLLMPWLIELCR